MFFIYLFLVGIIIGTAMIIPGVSGGVMAVIFNVYNKMIDALTNLFKDFKKNFIFLSILGLGILVGMIWFSRIMMFLYVHHEVETKLSFIGLILGGVPYLFKEVKKNTNKTVDYKVMLITIVSSLALWYVSCNVVKIDLDSSNNLFIGTFNLFLAGFIYSVGKVIPGVSGSFLLIIIGMYEYVLKVISNPFSLTKIEILKLIPFILGLVFGVVVLLKLINKLFKKHFRLVYSIIIGFVIGSIPAIIPTVTLNLNTALGILFMNLCFFLSFKLSK